MQLVGWEGGGLLCPFLKIEKKYPDFLGKNALIVYIYGLNFSFKMLFDILEKNSEIFPCGAFLFWAVDEMFIEVHLFQETSLSLKNSKIHTWK